MRLLKILVISMFLAVFAPECAFSVMAQQLKMVKWKDVKSLLQEKNDSLLILNFWATWCKPCVAELPHFEKIRRELSGEKRIRFRYISLDFAENRSRVQAFVSKKLPGAVVWLLDETDYNQWINQLDEKWSGAIPATLVFHPSANNRIFAEGEISEEKLRSAIEKVNPH